VNIFHQIIDTAEKADHLANDLAVLLRPAAYCDGNPTAESIHPEVSAALHRVQVAARDLARTAEQELLTLSDETRKKACEGVMRGRFKDITGQRFGRAWLPLRKSRVEAASPK
jgi:hypothetical protein